MPFGTSASQCRCDQIVAGLKVMADHDLKLMTQLIGGMMGLDCVQIFGITDAAAFDRRVPTISFGVDGFSPSEIAKVLASSGIYIWHGNVYAVELCKALNILDDGGVARVGLTDYNTSAEVEHFLATLAGMLQ